MTEREPDRYLTVDEVSERLHFSGETIRRWLRSGRLRGIRMGERRAGWRIAERDLDAFIRDRIATTEATR